MTKKEIGNLGETLAADYLVRHGYEIVARNFVIYGGEIDIVARAGSIYTFVEVRFRKNDLYGHPLETISRTKRQSLKRAIFAYAQKHTIAIEDCRFDAIGITKKPDNTGYRLVHVRGVEIG